MSDGDELSRFYDMFIAPNDARVEVLRDVVKGTTVARDVMITSTESNGSRFKLPAYCVYECADVGSALLVRPMRAFWELRGVTTHAMLSGPRTIIAMSALFGSMLAIQGASTVSEFLEGLWRGIF